MAFNPKNLQLIGPLNVRRTISPELKLAVQTHAAGVGEVVWAWNYCHSAFCRLFASITTPDNLLVGLAVWHTASSDSQQRLMLLAAAGVRFPKTSNKHKAIKWAISTADKLSRYRNDLAHMGTGFKNPFQKPEVTLDPLSNRPARLDRMSGVDIDKIVQHCTGDLVALGGYVSVMNAAISFPQQHKLPRRPQLRLLQDIRSKQKRRPQTNTKRGTLP